MGFDLVSTVKRFSPAMPLRRSPRTVPARNMAEHNHTSTAYGGDVFSVTSITLSETILNNYRAHAQNIHQDILDHMTNESLQFLAKQEFKKSRKRAIETIMEESMRSVVDEVFDTLEPYMVKLNESLNGTALTISFTHPADVTETLSFDRSRRPLTTISSYRARICTNRFSLVIKGKDSAVEFYFLPVEQVMALTRIECEHTPIMTFTGTPNCGLIDWEVEGKPLTSERLERYVLLLLDYLIKETRDALDTN